MARSKRIIFTLLLASSIVSSLCGCTLISGKLQTEIKDTNGVDDKSFSFEVTGAKGQTYEIRAAGESAKFNVKVTREFISNSAE